jgi:hypothetical protein
MSRARLILTAGATSAALILTPAAANAASPSDPQVQVLKAQIVSYTAAIQGLQTQLNANARELQIVQQQAAIFCGQPWIFGAQCAAAQGRLAGLQSANASTMAAYNRVLVERAQAQVKLAQLLATP